MMYSVNWKVLLWWCIDAGCRYSGTFSVTASVFFSCLNPHKHSRLSFLWIMKPVSLWCKEIGLRRKWKEDILKNDLWSLRTPCFYVFSSQQQTLHYTRRVPQSFSQFLSLSFWDRRAATTQQVLSYYTRTPQPHRRYISHCLFHHFTAFTEFPEIMKGDISQISDCGKMVILEIENSIMPY